MTYTEDLQRPADEAELRAWDWKADLYADERSIPWLARRTGKAQRTVYGYSRGEIVPPLAWLRDAAAILRRGSKDV
jgi:hypothetical protein